MHASCPAGFEIVEGLIPGRYVCRCSNTDLNIQTCNETTDDLLLKVRALCAWYIHGVVGCSSTALFTVHLLSRQLILVNCATPSYLMFPTTSTFMARPLSLSPYRTGCGALPSPTQTVPRTCSPQAVPVVTAAASRGTQTMRQSVGSLCLRIWPRGTSSALATEKVRKL